MSACHCIITLFTLLFAGAVEPAKAAQGQAGALLLHHQPPEGDRDPCHYHQAPPVRYR